MQGPRFREGEPFCFIASQETSLPICGKMNGKIAPYHHDVRVWLAEGKELFCKIPAKTISFGFVCSYDEVCKVVYAGAEWAEREEHSFFAILFVGTNPVVRIQDDNPSLFKVIDPERGLLLTHSGLTVSLSVMREEVMSLP